MGKVISEYGSIVGGGSSIQLSAMPTYTSVALGTIVQYTGATNETYTNGYFYKRGSSGWENVNVQSATEQSPIIFKIEIYEDRYGNLDVRSTPAEVLAAWNSGKLLVAVMPDLDDGYYNFANGSPSEGFYYFEKTEASWEMTDTAKIDVVNTLSITLTINGNSWNAERSIEKCFTQCDYRLPEANADTLGRVYQYLGATNPQYHPYVYGYFYKCVSDGEATPTYSWERIDVQPAALFTIYITGSGTHADPYVADKTPSEIDTAEMNGEVIQVTYNGVRLDYQGQTGMMSNLYYQFNSTKIINNTLVEGYTINLITPMANPSAWTDIQVINHQVEIPVTSSMATASASNLGKIVQYIGTTTSSYTQGYYYKCVSDGAVSPTYSWEQLDVQPSSSAVFTITLSGDGDTTPYSLNKTPAEVEAAYSAGQVLQIIDVDEEWTKIYSFNGIGEDNGAIIEYSFIRNYIDLNSPFFNVINDYVNLSVLTSSTWGDIEVTHETTHCIQVTYMPEPTQDAFVQYVGLSSYNYTQGHFYRAFSDGGSAFEWEEVKVQDDSKKADKVLNGTNGNFAGLDSNGNLTDSGKKASDFVLTTAIGTAAAKNVPTSGNASASQVVMGNDTRLTDARTPTSHNQAASTITAGTLGGQVVANATAISSLGTAQVRNVTISTTDLTPGTSALAAGAIYVVYET